jgi:hypothetical protein
MLYVITDFTYPQDYNQFTLDSGKLGCIQLVLESGGSIELVMNQLRISEYHHPQDLSIRCWLSDQKGGNPLPDATNQWILSALQRRVIAVYDTFAGLGPFDEKIQVALPPGTYWLNVLNLVNESNSFFLTVSTGA